MVILFSLSVAGLAGSQGTIAQRASESVNARPLRLPVARAGEGCPVSGGTRTTVPNQPHIFGAFPGALWFGDGPVYFSWSWSLVPPGDGATFSLSGVPLETPGQRAKTPWTAVPSFAGAIVVRGRAIDGSGHVLHFNGGNERGANEMMTLHAPDDGATNGLWQFWASSMWIPVPGCYGIQIDTTSRTEIVVFKAI
jgi:hypothetical protein